MVGLFLNDVKIRTEIGIMEQVRHGCSLKVAVEMIDEILTTATS